MSDDIYLSQKTRNLTSDVVSFLNVIKEPGRMIATPDATIMELVIQGVPQESIINAFEIATARECDLDYFKPMQTIEEISFEMCKNGMTSIFS